jgi:2-polyprenyl-3-methyl-5-hydroxy-6-metoxy-1,4-benzoquinol methylase
MVPARKPATNRPRTDGGPRRVDGVFATTGGPDHGDAPGAGPHPTSLEPVSEPTRGAQRAFYDEVWRDVAAAELNDHEQARMRAISGALDELSLGRTADVLEIGCGRGWLSGLVLRQYGPVTAYDLAAEPIAKARAAFPDVDFETRDVISEPPAGQFDLVVSSEVIEHIDDQASFTSSLVDATRPGGFLLLTTPNGLLRDRWERVESFAPQPIEKWRTPAELRALVAERCRVLASRTFFFDVGRDGPYALLANPPAWRIRGRFPRVDRLLGRTRLGLYQLLVAQRLA